MYAQKDVADLRNRRQFVTMNGLRNSSHENNRCGCGSFEVDHPSCCRIGWRASFQAAFERISDSAPWIGPKTPRAAKPFRSYRFAGPPL
jgi:hypothetical protein